MTYSQPPTWQIFAVIGLLALPSSAIIGVFAAWLWQHFAEHRQPE